MTQPPIESAKACVSYRIVCLLLCLFVVCVVFGLIVSLLFVLLVCVIVVFAVCCV